MADGGRTCSAGWARRDARTAPVAVLRLHDTFAMKTAVIPQVRVEPKLRADLDAVLLPGETLTEFV
jgi:hypothetical protein